MRKQDALMGAMVSRRAVGKLGVLGAAGLLLGAARPSPGLLPADPLLEWQSNPVGIDTLRPRFCWKLKATLADTANLMQRGFRLVVKGGSGSGRSDETIFDSGWVRSSRPRFTPAQPLPLLSQAEYHWSLAIEDHTGRRSDDIAAGRFVTGLLSAQDWRGRWIAAQPQTHKPVRAVEWLRNAKPSGDAMPLLRGQFREDRQLASAFLSVSGLGHYRLAINGQWLQADDLLSLWSDYDKTVYYDSFDVTALLRPGVTVLAVMLGNGFFNVEGVSGRYTKLIGSFGHPRLLLQLRLIFTDGSARVVGSDDSWLASEGPIRFSSIYGGEDHDARLEPAGWLTSEQAPAGFRAVSLIEAPQGELSANPIGAVGVVEQYERPGITVLASGAVMADFGHNFSGRPILDLKAAKPGQAVTMKPGELLLADGSIDQGSATGAQPGYRGIAFNYIAGGGAEPERWSPAFSYTGFRYLQIEGAEPSQIAALTGAFISLKTRGAGQFRCSDPQLEAIHALIVQALRSNLASVATDCPHREKLGWIEQLYLNSDTAMYNRDVAALYEKVARDMRDAQTVEGMVPSIAPEFVRFVNKNGESTRFRDTPEWGCAIVLASWSTYCTYGDARILEDNFAAMQRYIAYLLTRTLDGVLDFGLGDWFDIGPKKPGEAQLTSKAYTGTATLYGAQHTMARIARVLGRGAEAAAYEADASRTAEVINRRFLNAETGSYDRGSQTANAMALSFDLVPAALRQKTLAALIADIDARQSHVSAGDVGFHYVVRALSDAGRADVLLKMMRRPDAPSYAAQIAKGATALTEAWDAAPHASQNHFMLGHIERWFYSGLGGIRMRFDHPSGPLIAIEPQMPEGLDWVDVSYESVLGTVRVAWRQQGKRSTVEVDVPPGATAELRLPNQRTRLIGSGRKRFVVTRA